MPFDEDPTNLIRLEVESELSCHVLFTSPTEVFSYFGIAFSSNQIWAGATSIDLNFMSNSSKVSQCLTELKIIAGWASYIIIYYIT